MKPVYQKAIKLTKEQIKQLSDFQEIIAKQHKIGKPCSLICQIYLTNDPIFKIYPQIKVFLVSSRIAKRIKRYVDKRPSGKINRRDYKNIEKRS